MTRASKPSIGPDSRASCQRLSLWHAFDDIDQYDGAGQVLLGDALRRGGADVPATNYRNFIEHDQSRLGNSMKNNTTA